MRTLLPQFLEQVTRVGAHFLFIVEHEAVMGFEGTGDLRINFADCERHPAADELLVGPPRLNDNAIADAAKLGRDFFVGHTTPITTGGSANSCSVWCLLCPPRQTSLGARKSRKPFCYRGLPALFAAKNEAEGRRFELPTPCGASDFESDRWPFAYPPGTY